MVAPSEGESIVIVMVGELIEKVAATVWLAVTLAKVPLVIAPWERLSTVPRAMEYPAFGVMVKVWLWLGVLQRCHAREADVNKVYISNREGL